MTARVASHLEGRRSLLDASARGVDKFGRCAGMAESCGHSTIRVLLSRLRPPFESEGFWVEIGAQQLHVSLGEEPAPKRNHFAIAVADIDRAVEHLEQAGVSIRRGGEVAGAGAQAFARDPYGNLLELNQQ